MQVARSALLFLTAAGITGLFVVSSTTATAHTASDASSAATAPHAEGEADHGTAKAAAVPSIQVAASGSTATTVPDAGVSITHTHDDGTVETHVVGGAEEKAAPVSPPTTAKPAPQSKVAVAPTTTAKPPVTTAAPKASTPTAPVKSATAPTMAVESQLVDAEVAETELAMTGWETSHFAVLGLALFALGAVVLDFRPRRDLEV